MGSGMLSFKPGVKLQGLKTTILIALQVVVEVYRRYGAACVVTSGTDGSHGVGSLHYSGNALDFRTRHLSRTVAIAIAGDVKAALGPDYDVVLEWNPWHLHVEYQPK